MRKCPVCKAPVKRFNINANTVQYRCARCSWKTNKVYVRKGRS